MGSLVGADLFIILSVIDGVFDQNPRVNPNAKLIPHIPEITDSIRALAGDHGTSLGTGGMVTKITAAQIGLNAGFPTVILNGSRPENLYDLLEGKQVGTYIG